VTIRRLTAPTPIDVDRLAEIFDRYRVHYGEAPDAARAARWLDATIDAGRLEAFVAESGGEMVGFATATVVPASLRLACFWQIRDLYVSPSHRRTGIACALLDAVRETATEAGAVRLAIQTETDNSAALRLYEGSGYTAVEGYRSLMLSLRD
jgi:GNAT superfamily N-acetyltransferase